MLFVVTNLVWLQRNASLVGDALYGRPSRDGLKGRSLDLLASDLVQDFPCSVVQELPGHVLSEICRLVP